MFLSRSPWLSESISSVIPIYIAVIFLFTLANFCMATFMDPGIFPRGKDMAASVSTRANDAMLSKHDGQHGLLQIWL